jgi:acyl carrier protein
MTSLRSTIIEQMQAIAKDQGKALAPLSDDLDLVESGLDSLGFAMLVTRLEEALGFDPFTISKEAYYPVTFGDFVRFYEDAANSLELAAGGTR